MISIAQKIHQIYTHKILLPDEQEQGLQEILDEKEMCHIIGINTAKVLVTRANTNSLVTTLLNKEYAGREINELPRRIINPGLRVQQSATIEKIRRTLTLEEDINEQKIMRRLLALRPHKETIEYELLRQKDFEQSGRNILQGSIRYIQNNSQAQYKEYRAIIKEMTRQ